MGLFGPPKCPRCGGPLQETHYSLPPYWRCPRCVRENREKKAAEKKMTDLEKRIRALEEQKEAGK